MASWQVRVEHCILGLLRTIDVQGYGTHRHKSIGDADDGVNKISTHVQSSSTSSYTSRPAGLDLSIVSIYNSLQSLDQLSFKLSTKRHYNTAYKNCHARFAVHIKARYRTAKRYAPARRYQFDGSISMVQPPGESF